MASSLLPGGPSLRNDSADAPQASGGHMLPEAMTLSDRALMLTTDLNRMLGQGQDIPLGRGGPEQPAGAQLPFGTGDEDKALVKTGH